MFSVNENKSFIQLFLESILFFISAFTRFTHLTHFLSVDNGEGDVSPAFTRFHDRVRNKYNVRSSNFLFKRIL